MYCSFFFFLRKQTQSKNVLANYCKKEPFFHVWKQWFLYRGLTCCLLSQSWGSAISKKHETMGITIMVAGVSAALGLVTPGGGSCLQSLVRGLAIGFCWAASAVTRGSQ